MQAFYTGSDPFDLTSVPTIQPANYWFH